jgi:pimeloyl-ACP methyl ester carboxylesterase
MQYHNAVDNLYALHNLMKEYNWDKISLMGHSMGSVLSFVFASVFPSKVDLVIGIDALKPHIYDAVLVSQMLEDRIENFMIADRRNQEKSEPPAYPIEEMVEKLVEGTHGSVNKECAPYILKRNIKRSEKHPGKFYFARDSRLKYSYGANYSQDVCVELARRIDMPYMFIKAKRNTYYEKKIYHDQVVDVMTQNPKFEYHTVDSTHHLHLTEPEKAAGIISDFLDKHRRPRSKL